MRVHANTNIILASVLKEEQKIQLTTMMFSLAAQRLARASYAGSALRSTFARSLATVGAQLPSVELHKGFPPDKINLADFSKNKSIILLGLPGAFTPTW